MLLDRRAGKTGIGLSVRFGVNEELIRRFRERFARLELLDPDPSRRPGLFIRSVTELPIRFVAA